MPNMRILVVDDDADTLKFIETLLNAYGYQVVVYHTIARLRDEVLQQQPDLIILDLHIHVLDVGWHAFQALRAVPTTAHIPVLLCSTSHTFLRRHRRDLQSRHGDVLEKPFYPDALIAKIKALTNTTNT